MSFFFAGETAATSFFALTRRFRSGRASCRRTPGTLPRFPLRVIGEALGVAKSVKSQNNSRNAIEHVAIVSDEHQRSAILEQTFLQDFQRGNVEIVRRLVEKQHIRGLQHQLSDQDARAFTAGKSPNALIQRFSS